MSSKPHTDLRQRAFQKVLDIERLVKADNLVPLAEVEEILDIVADAVLDAQIEENQRYLDNIKAFRGRKPDELISFGSAGAGIVESSYEHTFEDRIAELTKKKGQ